MLGAVAALVTTTVVVGMSALPASAWASATAAAGGARACTAAWSILPSPSPGTSSGNVGAELRGVDGVSANDVWAVGAKGLDPAERAKRTEALAMHWNGSAWVSRPVPTVEGAYSELVSVAAITANNAWAVGFTSSPPPIPGPAKSNRGLIRHWNGKSWTTFENPLGATNNELLSVFALSASNVYAAGFVGLDGGPTQKPLVLHFDGSAWKQVTVKVPASGNAGFLAIGASAAGNVWAVGWRGPFHGNDQPFAERYDGNAWRIASPSSPAKGWLGAVRVFGPANAWAVGGEGSYISTATLAERFNGTAWSRVNTKGDSDAMQAFNGIAAESASSIWAVGVTGPDPMGASILIEHSTGTDFSRKPNPPTGDTAGLNAVVAVGTQQFAVGIQRSKPPLPPGTWGTLVLRRCG